MTNGITNNFPHHANTWMTKSIMPSLEWIYILENYYATRDIGFMYV
jgi:hypothetical protein